jgi:hypothetical protein
VFVYDQPMISVAFHALKLLGERCPSSPSITNLSSSRKLVYYSIFHERQPNGHELTLKSELYAAWRASSRRRESGCQDSFRTCVAHGPIKIHAYGLGTNKPRRARLSSHRSEFSDNCDMQARSLHLEPQIYYLSRHLPLPQRRFVVTE